MLRTILRTSSILTLFVELNPSFFEAVLVTAIFVKLGIPSIAITTLVTVAGYFVYTYVFTSWRLVLSYHSFFHFVFWGIT